MMTETLKSHEPGSLGRAVALLQAGGVVVFPTETVYGLGADARNSTAIAKIFSIKGRPPTNPLIVHVLDIPMAQSYVDGWNEACDLLSQAFWPGPLSLILKRKPEIPEIVAGGGQTLAVRAPSHPVARALLKAFEGPLAAPSANRSTGISPTRAEHVQTGLSGQIPLILDGGPCDLGLESTVVDMTNSVPRILRQGAISKGQIEEALKQKVELQNFDEQTPKSPGMMRRHYAPRKPLHLFVKPEELPNAPVAVIHRCSELDHHADRLQKRLPSDAYGFARGLYDALHWADAQKVEAIYVQAPPKGESWAAVEDRLSRAMVNP